MRKGIRLPCRNPRCGRVIEFIGPPPDEGELCPFCLEAITRGELSREEATGGKPDEEPGVDGDRAGADRDLAGRVRVGQDAGALVTE